MHRHFQLSGEENGAKLIQIYQLLTVQIVSYFFIRKKCFQIYIIICIYTNHIIYFHLNKGKH